MGGGAAVVTVPRHVGEGVAASVLAALTEFTATGGVLPLGLGGQTECLTRQFVQLVDEHLAVDPA